MQEKLEKLLEIAAYLKDDTYREQLVRIKRSLEEKTCLLTVMGQFSAGKSCLLNNLLGRKLLPVHRVETTALITLIRYGMQERAELLLRDGTLEEVPLEQSLELWQGGSGRIAEIQQISLYVDSPLLQGGLILADTPGVNTIIREHDQLAESIITGSDRVLYVMGKPMTEADRSFLNSILASGVQVLFARTHLDELQAGEEDADKTLAGERADLSGLTGEEIFFLSNQPDSAYYEGVDRLRAYLTSQLSARLDEAIQEIAAARLQFIASRLGQTLLERQLSLSKLLSGDRAAYQEEKAEVEAALAKMEAILEKNRTGLRKKYLDLRQEALEELEASKTAAAAAAARKIEALDLGPEPEAYTAPVEAILKSGCFQIQDAYLARFDQMLASNRIALQESLAGLDRFAGLSGQLPENLGQSNEQTQEAAERLRALQLLQEQLDLRIAEISKEQAGGQRDIQKLALEKKELAAAKEVVQRQLCEYPPYVAQYIVEEGTHANEDRWRTLGRIADVATILIPGDAWLKLGGKVFKGLKGAEMAEKGVKAARYADAAMDAARIYNAADGAKNKHDPLLEARQRVKKAAPSLLDYLSIEYYFAKIGHKLDKPSVKRIDLEHKRQYEQKREQIQRQIYDKAAEEAKKQAELLDISDHQKQLANERALVEKKKRAAEEQLARLKKELDAAAVQAKLREIRAFYTDLAGQRFQEFCGYVQTELAAQTDQAVEGYLGTYHFQISAQIKKKKRELEELEKRFRNGERTALEQELALCQEFASYLDSLRPEEQ